MNMPTPEEVREHGPTMNLTEQSEVPEIQRS